jgi:DNA-binding transcriptional LysR family regulator
VEFGSIYFPHVISTYRNRYPKVTFDLELGRPSYLMPRIESGDLDFAFVDTFPTKGQYYGDFGNFSMTPIIEEEVVLACSKDFNRKRLKNNHSYENLTSKSFISQQHNARALNNWFRHHFGKTTGKLNIVLTVANHQAVVSAVRHHVGLGIIVSHLVWKEIRSGSIVVIKKSAKQAVNRISVVQLLDKVPTITEKSFLNYFESIIQKSKTLGRLRLRVQERDYNLM